jgi:chemotaxis-related protein WspB
LTAVSAAPALRAPLRVGLRVGLRVAGQRFAVAAERIVEIIPRVRLRPLALAPAAVAGLFTWRGVAVPVVDLCRLLAGGDCADRLSSRILIVRLDGGAEAGGGRLIGLLAEGVSDILADTEAEQPALWLADAPFLGGVFRDGDDLVQTLIPESILPEALLAALLGPQASAR